MYHFQSLDAINLRNPERAIHARAGRYSERIFRRRDKTILSHSKAEMFASEKHLGARRRISIRPKHCARDVRRRFQLDRQLKVIGSRDEWHHFVHVARGLEIKARAGSWRAVIAHMFR